MGTVGAGGAMPTTKNPAPAARLQLLSQIKQLAQAVIYGSPSETYRQGVDAWSQLHSQQALASV
jgi:hypothetical protein